MAERFAKQVPSTSNTNALLDRIKKLEEKNNELRHRQTVPTLSPPLKPTPYEPPTPPALIPKPRTKGKAAKKSWYDWLVCHVPGPIRSATSRIKRQILRLYDNTEPREFEISSSESAFGNFTEKHSIQRVSGVDATSFLKMVKNTAVVGKLREKDNVKFRIVLVCLMEKPNPSGKKPEVKEAQVQESMAKYQKEGDLKELRS